MAGTQMTPQAQYWRDRLMTAHAWGIATEMILIGWLAGPGDLINFNKGPSAEETPASSNDAATAAGDSKPDEGEKTEPDNDEVDKRYDAFGFLIGFPLGHICYQLYVRWIYDDRLAGEVLDSTVIPRRTIVRFMTVKAVVVWLAILYSAWG